MTAGLGVEDYACMHAAVMANFPVTVQEEIRHTQHPICFLGVVARATGYSQVMHSDNVQSALVYDLYPAAALLHVNSDVANCAQILQSAPY